MDPRAALAGIADRLRRSAFQEKVMKRSRLLQRVCGLVGLTLWFSSIALFQHYMSTRTASPQPSAGRVHALHNHGSAVYVNTQERVLFYSLRGFGWGLGMMGAVIYHLERRKSGKSFWAGDA